MSLEFKDLLDYCQVEAIANKLSPTEAYVWRSICRDYSKKFNTPLPLVLEMDPLEVALHVYEDRLEKLDLDEYQNLRNILDTIYSIEDPSYEADQNKELEEDIKRYEEEEAERIRLGLPIHRSLGKHSRVQDEATIPDPELPKSGGINLSYLEKLDSEN